MKAILFFLCLSISGFLYSQTNTVACTHCESLGYVKCNYCAGDGVTKCLNCQGTGKSNRNYCPTCSGKRAVNCARCDGVGRTLEDRFFSNCTLCNGARYTTCPTCKGSGFGFCEKCGGNGHTTCQNCGNGFPSGYTACGFCNGKGSVAKQGSKIDLGVYSTADIASSLNIEEIKVIELIKSNKLKATLIDDKYFIRKEDFNAFMKK